MTNEEKKFIKILADGTLTQAMADVAAAMLKMSIAWREAIESAIKTFKLIAEKKEEK